MAGFSCSGGKFLTGWKKTTPWKPGAFAGWLLQENVWPIATMDSGHAWTPIRIICGSMSCGEGQRCSMGTLEERAMKHWSGLAVLVTGAYGFLASHMIEELLSRGASRPALSGTGLQRAICSSQAVTKKYESPPGTSRTLNSAGVSSMSSRFRMYSISQPRPL